METPLMMIERLKEIIKKKVYEINGSITFSFNNNYST